MYLNESSVLHTLRQRYGASLLHTYAGPSLLVLSPRGAPAVYSEKVCLPRDPPTCILLFLVFSLPVSTGFPPTLIVDLGKRVGTEGYPAIFNRVGGCLHFHA